MSQSQSPQANSDVSTTRSDASSSPSNASDIQSSNGFTDNEIQVFLQRIDSFLRQQQDTLSTANNILTTGDASHCVNTLSCMLATAMMQMKNMQENIQVFASVLSKQSTVLDTVNNLKNQNDVLNWKITELNMRLGKVADDVQNHCQTLEVYRTKHNDLLEWIHRFDAFYFSQHPKLTPPPLPQSQFQSQSTQQVQVFTAPCNCDQCMNRNTNSTSQRALTTPAVTNLANVILTEGNDFSIRPFSPLNSTATTTTDNGNGNKVMNDTATNANVQSDY